MENFTVFGSAENSKGRNGMEPMEAIGLLLIKYSGMKTVQYYVKLYATLHYLYKNN